MIRIAWICPDSTERQRVLGRLEQVDGATVVGVIEDYCTDGSDAQSLNLKVARPDVVIVNLEAGGHQAFACLRFLNSLAPSAALFVIGDEDPGLIIESMRRGVREYVRREHLDELVAAIKRVHSEKLASQDSSRKPCRIFSVVGAKGGVGTTTVALNLAHSLSLQSENVRIGLVDLANPLGDLAAHLDLKPQFTVENVYSAGDRLDAELLDSFTISVDKVSLLAGRSRIADDAPTPDAVVKLLDTSRKLFDLIVVDLSSSAEGLVSEAVFQLSEQIAVVFTVELPSLWRAIRVFDHLQNQGTRHKAVAILNRWRKNDPLSNVEVERGLRTKLFWSLPNDYAAVAQAVRRGQAISTGGRSGLGQSYNDLANKLVAAPEAQKGGILSLLR